MQTQERAGRSAVTPLTKILLVEDESIIRETVASTLRSEGFAVEAIADGQLALERLVVPGSNVGLGDLPDLLILDLMLPGVNGLDLCRYLRRQNLHLPILILSAKDTEMDRVVGLEVGADDYLTKPFSLRELVARCRALLRRSSQNLSGTAELLRYEDLCLYPSECRVSRAGDDLNLSPKEFRLLELFMRHPRRVWSREQLLEQVWGADFMGDSKTVDVHIRWLREKLEFDPSKPHYILTVRGFGYRFG
jgi:two-component system, OmpR family, phosphate regulon response regulator PhoB